MENGYDVALFIEIIVSEGARLLYHDDQGDYHIEYYEGRNGRKVAICLEDEYFPKKLVIAYLKQLGMEDLIERLYG